MVVSCDSKVGALPPCWDFANMSGTWDLGPHVNRPLQWFVGLVESLVSNWMPVILIGL